MSKRRGRPRKEGPRYPGGQLKPEGEAISAVVIQRLMRDAVRLGIDARLASQVGRLLMLKEFTPFHAAVAFRIASVYGRFERLHGLRRKTRSPAYERGSAAAAGVLAEDDEEAAARASGEFRQLQDMFNEDDPKEIWARDAIEQLCVEDCAINWMALGYVRKKLMVIGQSLGMAGTNHRGADTAGGGPGRGHVPLHFNAHQGPPPKAPAKAPNLDKLYWIETLRRLRPDLGEKDLNRAYAFTRARKDNELERRKVALRRRPDPTPASQAYPVRLNRPVLKPPKRQAE